MDNVSYHKDMFLRQTRQTIFYNEKNPNNLD